LLCFVCSSHVLREAGALQGESPHTSCTGVRCKRSSKDSDGKERKKGKGAEGTQGQGSKQIPRPTVWTKAQSRAHTDIIKTIITAIKKEVAVSTWGFQQERVVPACNSQMVPNRISCNTLQKLQFLFLLFFFCAYRWCSCDHCATLSKAAETDEKKQLVPNNNNSNTVITINSRTNTTKLRRRSEQDSK
jgi:hypothetical protein